MLGAEEPRFQYGRGCAGELGNRQWRAHSGELGAGEDLNGRPELLERRKDTGRASKRVVERRVNLPVAGDGAHLAQQELGTQAEAVGSRSARRRDSRGRGADELGPSPTPDHPADEDPEHDGRPEHHDRPEDEWNVRLELL